MPSIPSLSEDSTAIFLSYLCTLQSTESSEISDFSMAKLHAAYGVDPAGNH